MLFVYRYTPTKWFALYCNTVFTENEMCIGKTIDICILFYIQSDQKKIPWTIAQTALLISQTRLLESDTAIPSASLCHFLLYSHSGGFSMQYVVCERRGRTEDIPALNTHKELLNIHTAGNLQGKRGRGL